MRLVFLSLICAALALMAGVYWMSEREGRAAIAEPITASMPGEDVTALRQEVQVLREELARLQRNQQLSSGGESRAPAIAGGGEPAAPAREDRWYLDQYALSFLEDEQGSEFYRLAVEARLGNLVEPVCALLRDTSRVTPLRCSLARLLQRKRFQGHADVNGALVFCVAPPAEETLCLAALASLSVTGDDGALRSLEQLLFALQGKQRSDACLNTLQKLSQERWNATLLRLFPRASDTEWRCALVRQADSSDLESALQLFIASSTIEQPVRLAAAIRIGEYPTEEFRSYVQQWLGFEMDPEVREALGASQRRQTEIPGWHAMQACGAPDADFKRDDPKAWAPRSAECGLQWIELSYATPMNADRVVIHETCAPGAIQEVLVRTRDGEWQLVLRADRTAASHPLVIEFSTIASVSAVKLVLDTNRVSGWNEIDAVQLLGTGGMQWAKSARASSTYGGGSGGIPLDIQSFFSR